ncbi:hypothetical protein [Natronobacterium gregoryi]|uniref:Uncharacterized protein n=2 Tax=Natronobacterium gregoryi TaxID=44930 RepID=L0ALC1_NATGS|nr:hypothetical protein [Natronobacterium gregoryi]AFZ73850.1 hypothetical protein Natgr_2701 [Natronobacterium gregoryi SP2]ELY65096.1 hypothetical protein C490_14040 [Natronobacterium gregoryi SP2]PLK19695.1 hypothetical protein CYV19_13350 [Natronobacterium gregoryi SP2]SFJ42509.1 hypothetical protein SAMN05443661_12839 [Natronobacterium gregoryi]
MESSDTGETLESYGSDIGKRTNSWTRFREWVLVEADRLFITAIITVGVFVGFLVLNDVGVVSFVNDDSITRLAGGMIAGTFSLVTLVVSINQLILSREFAAAGESEKQLQGVLEFREETADATGVSATPASPTRLLELLTEAIDDHATTFENEVATHPDDDLRTQVDRYVAAVQESSDRLDDTLEHTKFGTFRAVSAAIGYDDAWQLYGARHLRGAYGDDLSEDARDSLEALIDVLELFGVAREHFKTTYLQRELTRFSQLTLYCGVPAILSAMLIGFLYADLGGASVSIAYLPYVVSALIAVVVSPLALLTAYILRTASVTRRTASVGPMLPQKDPGEGPFDVSYGAEPRSEPAN